METNSFKKVLKFFDIVNDRKKKSKFKSEFLFGKCLLQKQMMSKNI